MFHVYFIYVDGRFYVIREREREEIEGYKVHMIIIPK